MKCPNCGKEAAEGDRFCNECGTVLPIENKQEISPADTNWRCPVCGSYWSESTQICQKCGSARSERSTGYAAEGGAGAAAYKPEMPMKWYKFIIYFQIWVSLLLNLSSAIQYMTGTYLIMDSGDSLDALGMSATEFIEFFYSMFPSMKTIDYIFAFLAVALAAGCIFVYIRLRDFRTKAPWYYLGLVVCAFVISLLHAVALSSATGINLFDAAGSNILIQFIATGVYVVLNYIYFEKREHLFVN